MTPTRSLRARLTLLFTLATTGLMLLVGGGMLGYSAYAADQTEDRVLTRAAYRVRSELIEEGVLKPEELVREENELLERAGGAILVVDRQGRMLARSQRNVPSWPRADDGWRTVAVPAPEGTVIIGLPWSRTRAALQVQAVLLATMVCCVALFTSVGAWVLVGRVLRPIRMLARRADAARVSTLRACLEPPSEDAEIVELVATLNGLLDRVAQTGAARGRFYAAASHELRTPLQALSGHLELALTRPRTTPEYLAVVEEASGQTRRLTRLVQELLLLNQLHHGTSRPPTDPVDLAETVRRILLQLDGEFESQQLRLAVDLPEEAEAEAPAGHVEIILRNLLENAAKYARPGTTVPLRLTRTPGGWAFEVYNECADSVKVRPEQVFEPFFRPDAARNSRTGGNGLGLAICKAVAEANAWSLDWRRETHGVRAVVEIPTTADGRVSVSSAEERVLCAAGAVASR